MTIERNPYKAIRIPNYILEEFADMMQKHFDDENNLSMGEFLRSYNVSRMSLSKWKKRNIKLKQVHDLAKDVIAERHLINACKFKQERHTSRFLASLYSTRVREHEAYLAGLANKADNSAPTKVVFQLDSLTGDDNKKDDDESNKKD